VNDREQLLERLARLAIEYGANVQPGQVVNVNAEYGQHELARAIAAHAYRRGARFVDVWYFDPFLKRARIEHADEATLDYVPPWYAQRALGLGELHGAHVSIAGSTQPGLLDDLDPARLGRDLLPRVKENFGVINDKTTNWLVMPGPTEGWARQVYADADDPLGRLWEEIAFVTRLDAEDPVAAWRERFAQTGEVGRRLTELRLDALHFEGPGTDLTVGLLPTSLWQNATETTVDGLDFVANLPSEELTSTPDPARTEGVVRATRPLVLSDGTLIEGITVRFEGGRAVEVDADVGGEALRGRTSVDEGARRLGEVALVDREGRIGPLGTVFYNTLLDENAASHLAFGGAYETLVGEEDVEKINRSELHLDFMIGSDEVSVTGVTRDGGRIPVLRDGVWQV
jgi:aminopeptidase